MSDKANNKKNKANNNRKLDALDAKVVKKVVGFCIEEAINQTIT
jgi:hypothetical protein